MEITGLVIAKTQETQLSIGFKQMEKNNLLLSILTVEVTFQLSRCL